jgi:hypothetical protein
MPQQVGLDLGTPREKEHMKLAGNNIVESKERIRRRKKKSPLMEINGQNSDDQCLPNGQERIPGLKCDFSLEEDTSMIASSLHYDGSREGSATVDDLVQTQTDLQGPQDGQNIYYLSHDINTSGSKRSRSKVHEDINIRASSSTNNSAEAIRCHSSTFSKMKLGEGCGVGNENSRRTPYSSN